MHEDLGRISREQAELSDDIEAVAAYGRDHADVWGNVRFLNEPTVMIEVAFTADHDQHRDALQRIVRHPQRLRVLPARFTHAYRCAVLDEVVDWVITEHRERFVKAGNGWDAVELHVTADGTHVAEQLWARYSDVLELVIGTKPFRGTGPPTGGGRSQRVPDAGVEVNGVLGEIVLAEAEVPSGTTARGRVVLTNRGDAAVRIHGGQMVGSVVLAGTNEIVGVYTSPVQAWGRTLFLQPGDDGDFPLLVGTASTLANAEPLLPPGDYEATCVVYLARQTTLVARCPITLTSPLG